MGAETDFVERLAELLDGRPRAGDAEVIGWRFSLSTGWSLQAGLKDDQLGGPYEPPATARGTSGRGYLRWSDGCVSHVGLDTRTLDDFDQQLLYWRLLAYLDPDRPDILEPQPLPKVQTHDPAVAELVEGDPAYFIDFLLRARNRCQSASLGRLQAESGASTGWRFVYSSRGLRVAYPTTAVSFGLAVESRYARSLDRRSLAGATDLDDLIDDVVASATNMTTSAEPTAGLRPILLDPSVAMGLVSKFVVTNLSGADVVSGRSAFALDDFRRGRPVLRADLSLVVDSTLDFELAASPVSSEGVPGGKAGLIDAGRLVRPFVDLKYSARAGFPPTPVPAGPPGFLLRAARPPRTRDELLSAGAADLLVHDLLGLRTQDARSGRYALVAPRALVIRAGRPLGRAKVGLRGSLFEQLLDPRTELVSFPWGLNPGLLVWAEVEPQA